MAKVTGLNPELLDAIRGLGIEPNNASKIIIEIDCNAPVKVHVQGYPDTGLLGVVKAIDGDIAVVREAASVEITDEMLIAAIKARREGPDTEGILRAALDIVERDYDVTPKERRCAEDSPEGFTCARPSGHGESHVAVQPDGLVKW